MAIEVLDRGAVSAELQLVVFALDDYEFALRLTSVDRVVRSVEITPAPHAPSIVLGIINVQGQIIPVIDVRKRIGLGNKSLDPSDQFIVVHTSRRSFVLVVDQVMGVVRVNDDQIVIAESVVPGLEQIEGIVKLRDGIVYVQDLDRFLSIEEEQALTHVLESPDVVS